jgi:hypothetical protein
MQNMYGPFYGVVHTDKLGCFAPVSWNIPNAVVKIKRHKYGGAALKLAHCTAIIRYEPTYALICPGYLEEGDLIGRCLDANIPVVLFNKDGILNDNVLTREAMNRWASQQA